MYAAIVDVVVVVGLVFVMDVECRSNQLVISNAKLSLGLYRSTYKYRFSERPPLFLFHSLTLGHSPLRMAERARMPETLLLSASQRLLFYFF